MDCFVSADRRRARRMLQTSRFVVYLILIFLSVMCLFSFYMLIINATRSNADLQGGFRIILPMLKPALAVQLIFSFVQSWNNYFLPVMIVYMCLSKYIIKGVTADSVKG